MAKKLDPKKTVTFKDFLITNANQIDALCQLLIENGADHSAGIFYGTQASSGGISSQAKALK